MINKRLKAIREGRLIEDLPQRHRVHGGCCFFAGRETTASEKSLRLRRTLLSLDPTVDMKPPGYEIVPAGLRSLARSEACPAEKRGSRSGKNIVPSVLSVSQWLVDKCAYRNQVSRVCGAKSIGFKKKSRSPSFVASKGLLPAHQIQQSLLILQQCPAGSEQTEISTTAL